MLNITKGKLESAQKIIIYGPEGIGKSTFAAKFPDPLFIDTEGSTKMLDVARLPRPTSWTMLLNQVRDVRDTPHCCKTLVIDTADWAEHLCIEHICAKAKVDGLESFGYGKGYTYLEEEFGRFLNLLEEIVSRGVHVVLTAHSTIKRFEQPDEMGSYDRYAMKLQKKTTPLCKEWADAVLFVNFKTLVVNTDGQGAQKGKNKAQGGKRVMYTTHHSCWDAKNRYGMADEVEFDFSAIAPFIAAAFQNAPTAKPQAFAETPLDRATQEAPPTTAPVTQSAPPPAEPDKPKEPPAYAPGIPIALRDLMAANLVTEKELQTVVAARGYYPGDTPITKYDPAFITGVLIGAWAQVYGMVESFRSQEAPF